MQLTDFLQQLGLTVNESHMYIALLSCNTSPASLVAKKCNIDRSNSYKLLDSLIEKGFTSLSLKGGTKYYTALDVHALKYKIEQLASNYEQLLPQLQELTPLHSQGVETQYFEGMEGFRSMRYSNVNKRRESMKQDDNTRWGYQDHALVSIILPQLEEYRNIKKEDEYIKILTNDATIEKNLHIQNRIIKFLPNNTFFNNNTMWICGEYCIIITQDNQKTLCQQSYNPAFARSMKTLIQYIRAGL